MFKTLRRTARLALIAVTTLTVLAPAAHAAPPASSAEGFSAGIDLRPQADAAELGLPIYPGATPRPDDERDRNALTMSLWGGKLGFRLVVMKLQSKAPMEQVASFYQQALGRYGTVLDCSGPRPPVVKGEDDKVLRCDSEAPKGSAREYKAGVPNHHRVVVLKPQGSQVLIDLVRFELGR